MLKTAAAPDPAQEVDPRAWELIGAFLYDQDAKVDPYAAYADSLGLQGIRVDKPEDVGRAIDEALSATRPAVIDVYTDPDVPTLPPHITFEEAKNFSTALLRMDPDEAGIIKESVKSLVEGIVPGIGEKDR